jgi:hypothetical protein
MQYDEFEQRGEVPADFDEQEEHLMEVCNVTQHMFTIYRAYT